MKVQDIAFVSAVLAWGYNGNGPLSVVVCASWLLHILAGRPTLHMTPYYFAFPLALRGLYSGGLQKDSLNSTVYLPYVAAGIAIGATLLFGLLHMLLPLTARLPKTSGPYQPAMLQARIQNPNYGADFMLQVMFPSQLVYPEPQGNGKKGKAKKTDEQTEPLLLSYLTYGGATARGYAYFMKVPSILLTWLQYLPGVFWDGHPAFTPLPSSPPAPAKFPVIVFSHGLGGTPDCYSHIIAEAVSQGWVVCAMEHADGSAAYTEFPDGYTQRYFRLPAAEKKDQYKEYKFRHRQLKQRVSETRSVLDLITKLAGEKVSPPEEYVPDGAKNEGDDAAEAGPEHAPASEDTDAEDIELIKYFLGDRVDVKRIVLMGHSFGAATCIATADRDIRPCAVVALDPWMFPLSPSTLKRGLASVPVLSLCGDYFTAWPENAVALRLLLSAAHRASHAERSAAAKFGAAIDSNDNDSVIPRNGILKNGEIHPRFTCTGAVHPSNVLFTMPGIEHQNFNDFAVLMRRILRVMRMIGPEDPVVALKKITTLSMAFASQAVAAAGAAAVVRASPAKSSGGKRAAPAPSGANFVFEVPSSLAVGKDVLVAPWTKEHLLQASESR